MTDHDAFLQQIVASPDDDVPRLIYADWLEERGDPRADFIRIQCQLATLPDDDVRRGPLTARASVLQSEHESTWRAQLPLLEGITWGPFQRGFVEAVVAVNWQAFRHHAAKIFAAAPVRQARLQRLTPQTLAALADSPWLARLSTLSLAGIAIEAAGAEILATSPHVANLVSLDLNGGQIRSLGLKALAASPHLAKLSFLYLSRNLLEAPGTQALATSAFLTRLTALSLSHNPLSDCGIQALMSGPALAQVTNLFLNSCRIEDAGATALAKSPHLGNLTLLDLGNNMIGVPGIQALAGSEHLRRLATLDLDNNNVLMSIQPLLRKRFGAGVRF